MTDPRRQNRREFLVRAAQAATAAASVPSLLQHAAAAASAPAGRWQIGCYTRPWAAWDYRVAMDDIATAGFQYLGLMTTNSTSHLVIGVGTPLDEAQKIGEEAKQRSLQIISVYGGDFPVEKSLAAGIEGLRHLIDACAAAKAKTLLLGGTGDEKLYPTYYKAVAECCDYAAAKGVGLTAKPHGGLNATGPQLRKCAELVGKRNFSIWYDAGNVFFYSDGKLNPVVDAAALDGLVSGWCIKDFAAEPAKRVDLTPGTGRVDFQAVLGRLRKGGFTGGPLVVETLAPGGRPHLMAEAKKARKFLEQLVV
jgi:sugar phosphate isomerase/epimerase